MRGPITSFGKFWGFYWSSSFSIMVYIEINSANSPEVGALSNPLVCWTNVLIKIAAPLSVNVGGYLYTNITNFSYLRVNR